MTARPDTPSFLGPPRYMVPDDLGALTHAKVFGERNTGTNFLVEALALNAPALAALTHEHRSLLPSLARRLPGAWGRRLYNAALDRQRAAEMERNFGWKHAAIEPAALRAVPLHGRCLLLCVIRNPYYFLNALYRRPYHLEPPPRGSRAAFLSAPVRPNRRDAVGAAELAAPVCLWNRKVASYLDHAEALGLVVLRYEDAVNDFDAMLDRLAAAGVPVVGQRRVPLKSSKGDAMEFADYVEKTNRFDPQQEFSPCERDMIRCHLDRSLCERLGYPVH